MSLTGKGKLCCLTIRNALSLEMELSFRVWPLIKQIHQPVNIFSSPNCKKLV